MKHLARISADRMHVTARRWGGGSIPDLASALTDFLAAIGKAWSNFVVAKKLV